MDPENSVSIQKLEYASLHSLDRDTFKAFAAIDWRSVCFDECNELGSIDLLVRAVSTQIAGNAVRIAAATDRILAPFFRGSPHISRCKLSEIEKFMFVKLHALIRDFCESYPRSSETISRCLKTAFPFHTTCHPHEFVAYVWNMLQLVPLLHESDGKDLLLAVVDKIYLLDVNINYDDTEEERSQMKIDASITCLIDYLMNSVRINNVVDESRVLQLYSTLFPFFTQTLCPSSKPLQSFFWMFALATVSTDITHRLIEDLWQLINSKAGDPFRLLGVMTSFCTRSTLISADLIQSIILRVANMCHDHLNTCPASVENTSLEKHTNFYAAIQSLMYVIVIRSSDLPDPTVLQVMDLRKLVVNQLYPLSVCPEGLADAFTRVTHELHISLRLSHQKEQAKTLRTERLPEVWISLPLHQDPLPSIRQAIGNKLRIISDPDLTGAGQSSRSCSYEQRFCAAESLDFTF